MVEHFKRYNDVLYRINELSIKLIGLKERIKSAKSISFDKSPKSNSVVLDTLYFLAEIEELEKKIEQLKKEKDKIKERHEKEINKLGDIRYKSIIRMIYIEKMNINNVACALNVSISYARTLKSKAIIEFKSKNNIK